MVTPSNPQRLFSSRPSLYARYRPSYPDQLYTHLVRLLPGEKTGRAWDCATGSGQVAIDLSRFVPEVVATDVSPEQLSVAPSVPNVFYCLAESEQSPLADRSVDLVTVACGLHWFDREAFYREVKRVCVPGGILAAWAYGPSHLEPEEPPIRDCVREFSKRVLTPFWSPGNELTKTRYRTLSLPFEELPWPRLAAKKQVDLDHFLGYLRTWSAVQRYLRKHGTDPIDDLAADLKPLWGEPTQCRTMVWPLFGRIGRI